MHCRKLTRVQSAMTQGAAPSPGRPQFASAESLESSIIYLNSILAGEAQPGRQPGLDGAAIPSPLLPILSLGVQHRTHGPPSCRTAERGLGGDLELLSIKPQDVAVTCNTIYGLVVQQQKETSFRDQLKQGGGVGAGMLSGACDMGSAPGRSSWGPSWVLEPCLL